MNNSVLFQVFNSLSPIEVRELGRFIRSPYINRRNEVSRLYDFFAQNVSISEGALKKDMLRPGQRVFMDQLESQTKGRRMHTTGNERSIDKFCGSTIFCDAASHYISVQHQVNLTAAETLKSKSMFERQAQEHGWSDGWQRK